MAESSPGGIFYGKRGWSVGAFSGSLNNRLRIDVLEVRTGEDWTSSKTLQGGEFRLRGLVAP